MDLVLSYLWAIYFFATSAFFLCVSALICLCTAPSQPTRRAVHLFSCWWGYHYIQINPFWKVSFEGLENIDPKGTYVLVPNHQSYFDILILYGLFRMFKWVSKESIFNIPFVGANMRLNQYVRLARGDLKSIKEMMATCRMWLGKGASIIIFPEGTRSLDGEIHEFRDGPFKLSADCNAPVIPIVVDGTHTVFAKSAKKLTFNCPITVRILKPVTVSQFDGNVRQMRDHVRQLMIENLSEIRGRLPAPNVAELAQPKN